MDSSWALHWNSLEILFFYTLIYGVDLGNDPSLLLALLHMVLTWSSKLSFESIFTANNLSKLFFFNWRIANEYLNLFVSAYNQLTFISASCHMVIQKPLRYSFCRFLLLHYNIINVFYIIIDSIIISIIGEVDVVHN